MLEVLRKIAGGSRPATAAQLREALGELDEAALAAAVQTADAEFKDALLAADEKRLAKAETALATARRDLDRCRAAIEVLTQKAAQAEVSEASEAIENERRELEREADAVAADLRKQYPAAARQLIGLLERLQAAEEKVSDFNRRHADKGVVPIKAVEQRAFEFPANQHAELFSVLHTSLWPRGGQPGWGAAKMASELAGI